MIATSDKAGTTWTPSIVAHLLFQAELPNGLAAQTHRRLSEGRNVEEATANLKEAVELFLDSADPTEVAERLRGEVYVTRFEATRGRTGRSC